MMDAFVSTLLWGVTVTSISSYYANAYLAVAKPVVQYSSATSTSSSDNGGQVASASESAKTFVQVTLDARAALDAGYKNLGKKADYETTGAAWEKIGLDKLDRRSLYAIASNQGGLFSQVEADAAKFFMTKQEGASMVAADPTNTDPVASHKAYIDFLDNVSDEEKSSLSWAKARGSAQWAYEHHTSVRGIKPENVDTGNPIVNLFANAYNELTTTKDASLDSRDMPSWLKATDLWHLQNETAPTLSWTL